MIVQITKDIYINGKKEVAGDCNGTVVLESANGFIVLMTGAIKKVIPKGLGEKVWQAALAQIESQLEFTTE